MAIIAAFKFHSGYIQIRIVKELKWEEVSLNSTLVIFKSYTLAKEGLDIPL